MTLDHPFGLPEAIYASAVERLVVDDPEARAGVMAALCAEHPEHAAALRELAAALNGANQVLARTFAEVGLAIQFAVAVADLVWFRARTSWSDVAGALLDAASAGLALQDEGAAEVADAKAALRVPACFAALHRGRIDEAERLAALCAETAQGWRDLVAASRVMDAIWRAAPAAARAAPRDRAIEAHERTVAALAQAIAAEGSSPATAACLAQARLRLALARRERGDALDAAAIARDVAALRDLRGSPRLFDWDQQILDQAAALDLE